MTRKAGPFDIRLGAAIRELRLRRGMTQERLGGSIGVSFQQIQKFENGRDRLSCAALWHLAAALKVPPGRLLAMGARSTR